MKKAVVIGAAMLALAGSTAVYAQHRMHHREPFQRMSVEDRAAFLDARIASIHAGLKLNADQEKNWPAVETAVRDFAKLRMDRANARMSERDARRADRDSNRGDDRNAKPDANAAPDPIARLRNRADDMAATGNALKKIVDAADPLYKSLDDGQKRRLMRLTGMGFGGREGFGRDMGRDRMEHFGRPMEFEGRGGRDGGPRGEHSGPDAGPDKL